MKTRDICEWLLGLVTHGLEGNRSNLGAAMRAELQTLDQGRAAWTLGCVTTVVCWRMIADGLFFLSLLIIAPLANDLTFIPLLWMPASVANQLHAVMHLWFLIGPAILCAILAAYRPIYWRLIGFGVPLVSHGVGFLRLLAMERAHGIHGGSYQIDNAPIVVGLAANLGVCFFGAWIGRTMRHSRA